MTELPRHSVSVTGVLVGHEVLHLPSVSVIPVYDAGRVLLVRHAGLHDGWGQSLAVPSEWASHQQIQP